MAAPKKTDIPAFGRLEDRIEATLLDARRLFICDAFDKTLADTIIKQLWYLEIEKPKTPILIVINSPGGSTDAGFAIWDQIKLITSPVVTLVTGIAASMGSVLSLAAPKGKRFATPKSRVMIHQPSIMGVMQGQATDLEIQAKEVLKTKQMLIDIYVEATGKDAKTIEKALDRDRWFASDEALEFGLLDGIITSFSELEPHLE